MVNKIGKGDIKDRESGGSLKKKKNSRIVQSDPSVIN